MVRTALVVVIAFAVGAACKPAATASQPAATTPPSVGTVAPVETAPCRRQGHFAVTIQATKQHDRTCFVPAGEEIAVDVTADEKADLTGEPIWEQWESHAALDVAVRIDDACVVHFRYENAVEGIQLDRLTVELHPDGTATGLFESRSYGPGWDDEHCEVPVAGRGSFTDVSRAP